MAALLRRVFHVTRLCIARMIKKCYANSLTQDVAKFAATSFMNIATNDAKGTRDFSPPQKFYNSSLDFSLN